MVFSKQVQVTQVQQAQVEAKNLRRTQLGRQMRRTNQTGRQQMEFYKKKQQVMYQNRHPSSQGTRAPAQQSNDECEDCVDMNCVWDKINKCAQEHNYVDCEEKLICKNEAHHKLWYEQSCQWSRGDGCWQDLYCEELPIRKQVDNCVQEHGWENAGWMKCEREHKCSNHEFLGKAQEMCDSGNQDVCWQVSNCEEIDYNIQTEECVQGDWQKWEECEYKEKCTKPEFLEIQERKCQRNEWDCWMTTRCEDLESKFGQPPKNDNDDCDDVRCIDEKIQKCAEAKNWAMGQWSKCQLEHLCEDPAHMDIYEHSDNCKWDKKEGYQCWIHQQCVMGPQQVQVEECYNKQTDNGQNWDVPNAWDQCEMDEKCSNEPLMDELQHMCDQDPSHRNACWPVEHCHNIPLNMQVNECTRNGGDWEECEHQHKCQSGEFLRRQENKCQKDEWNCWERDNCERLNEKFGVPAPPMPQRDQHDHYPHDNQGQQQISEECVAQVNNVPECQEQQVVQDCLQGDQQRCQEIEEFGPPRECEVAEIGRACSGEDEHHHDEHHHDYMSEEYHHHDEFNYHSEEYHHHDYHSEEYHHDEFHNEYDSVHSDEFHYEEPMEHYSDDLHHELYDSFHHEEPMYYSF